MNDPLIVFEKVGKKFSKTHKSSMVYGIKDLVRGFLGWPPSAQIRRDEFWVFKDIEFQVSRGECLGLIGANGVGKSTLLKIISGIISPDSGRVKVWGRVGALIELGAGFHPQLTGRENIFVYGSVLGMTRDEILSKLDLIIEFSGLSEFLDMPVKHYSSGMLVRLGFSVAVHLQPDVLLIDEVLAVGDAEFRCKCYDYIFSVMKKTATIIVSHNMANIARVCNKVVFVNKGVAKHYDNPILAIDDYLIEMKRKSTTSAINHEKGISIKNIQVGGDLLYGGKMCISFQMERKISISDITIEMSIINGELMPLATTKKSLNISKYKKSGIDVSFEDLRPHLLPGRYSLSIAIFDSNQLGLLAWSYNTCEFCITGDPNLSGAFIGLEGEWRLFAKIEV